MSSVSGGGGATASSQPSTSTTAAAGSGSQMNPLLESIINLRNASRGAQPAMQMNHTLQTTFGGPLEASARSMVYVGRSGKF